VSAEKLPEIPDEYLTEIGRVTTRWAMLESVIDLCLTLLIGNREFDVRSAIIFNHMAFPMRIDVMGALVSQLLPDYSGLAEFPTVHQLLKQAQEKRNLIAHSKWGVDEQTGQVTVSRLTARGKLKTSIVPISVAEITAAADLIAKAAHDLLVLVVNAGTTNIPPQSGQ
jgi:hypothetical protein